MKLDFSLINPEFSKKDLRKWTLIALVIKLFMFGWFAFNVYHYWEAGKVHHVIAAVQGDTKTYYNPAEDFVQGNGYTSICRMPGILPIYAPFSYFFGQPTAKVSMIVIQFFCSVISVVLLGWIASVLFRNKKAMSLTILLYGVSTFVSIWDHFLMSDSLSISFLIFSIFFLIRYLQAGRLITVLWSGLFITWSVFLRQIDVVVIPVAGIILIVYQWKHFGRIFKSAFVFALPFVFFIGTWTYYNYQKTSRIIPLIAPFDECFKITSEQLNAIGDLVRAWGENSVHWTEGGSAQWLLTNDYKGSTPPVSPDVFTSRYNLDSLIQLKTDFGRFQKMEIPSQKDSLGMSLLERATAHKRSYVEENSFDYYFLNRIQLIRRFVFPGYIDNVPGPPYQQMNVLHKGVKGASLLMLMIVSLLGILGTVTVLLKRDLQLILWLGIPWSILFVLACILGYIEQRYLAPVYPFFLIFGVYFLLSVQSFIQKRKIKN
ncbi:MAG: glycosyltransferase family 39 protein [Flavobacteriales bacterium]